MSNGISKYWEIWEDIGVYYTTQFCLLFHLGLEAMYLHSFAGGLAGLRLRRRLRRFAAGIWIMAITAWLTVITGTWIVYPWYRAKPADSTANLEAFPQRYLLANPDLAVWHHFAMASMEWKEHVGWVSPILATAVAYVVIRYGPDLEKHAGVRKALITLVTLAFIAARIAAAINKVVLNAFLDIR
jgi:hypothetical protein